MFICSSSLCECAFGGGKKGDVFQENVEFFRGRLGCILLLMHSTLRFDNASLLSYCAVHTARFFRAIRTTPGVTSTRNSTEKKGRSHLIFPSLFSPSLPAYMDTDVAESRHHRGFSTVWGASAVVAHAKRGDGLLRGETTFKMVKLANLTLSS